MKSEIFSKLLGVGLIAGSFVLGTVSAKQENVQITDQVAAETSSVQTQPPVRVISDESAVISAIQRDSPAVVSIVESAEVPKIEMCAQQGPSSTDYYIPYLCQTGTELQRVGAGSGFIVSSDGYIVTNDHVVSDPSSQYTVILNTKDGSGKKISATVLARDSKSDIAVIKINMNNLPYLTFADSSKIRVGQTAIAIGYALGQFDNSVSKGVISGLSRSIEASDGNDTNTEVLNGLVQTDAAINPGNSGGPLLDLSGNVMAMNVAMASAQNIGFAIPGNLIQKAYETVRNTGKL